MIVAGMNKKYGTSIELQFTPGGTFTQEVARATQELNAGKPSSSDMIYNNSGGALKGSEIGLYRSLPWEKYLERPMIMEDGFDPFVPGGVGIATASTLIGVLYNSDYVKGDDIPKSLNDILDPKWKGKIAATPFAMGMREFAMPEVLGQEAMIDFTEKLSDQIAGLIPCGQVNKVTSGEFLMLVFGCGDQYPNMAAKRGEPLGYALMEEAVFSHTRYGMVPVHSEHPNAATLFLVWLHSEEGQKWMWEEIGMDFHLYPESNNRKKLQAMRDQGQKSSSARPNGWPSRGLMSTRGLSWKAS